MPAVRWSLSAACGRLLGRCSKPGGDDDRDQALREVCGIPGFGRADDEPGGALVPGLHEQRVAKCVGGGGGGIEAGSDGERVSARALEVRIQLDTAACARRNLD